MNRLSDLQESNIIAFNKFPSYFGEHTRNELCDPVYLSDGLATIIAFHIENCDDAETGRLIREILKPHIDHVLKVLAERYPALSDDGPVCSTGYGAEDEESAMLDRRDRARSCK